MDFVTFVGVISDVTNVISDVTMCEDEMPETLKDFAMEIFDVIRDIQDPEKPQTLEELEVLTEDSVTVYYLDGETDAR